MKKEQILYAIKSLKEAKFCNEDITQMLVSLFNCDNCAFYKDCDKFVKLKADTLGVCQDFLSKVVKGVKK